MSVGVVVYNFAPTDALELAVAADELGFDAVWFGEHMFSIEYSSPRASGYGNTHNVGRPKVNVVDPSAYLLDPWVALGAVASVTTRLRLATGVIVLPLRHPLVVAHQAASMHGFSRGRFMLGVGAGWMKEEFDALDMPFESRGERADEALQILRLAQSGEEFAFHGQHFDFPNLRVSPDENRYPLIIGGNSKRALRRAAEYGDAWYTSGSPEFEDALKMRDHLHGQRDKLGRTGEFRSYFRVADLDESIIDKYANEGIDDLVVWGDKVWPKDQDLDGKRAALTEAASKYGLI